MPKRKYRHPHVRIPTERIKWMPPLKASEKVDVPSKGPRDDYLDADGFHLLIRKR